MYSCAGSNVSSHNDDDLLLRTNRIATCKVPLLQQDVMKFTYESGTARQWACGWLCPDVENSHRCSIGLCLNASNRLVKHADIRSARKLLTSNEEHIPEEDVMKVFGHIASAVVLSFACSAANATMVDFTDRSAWTAIGGGISTSIDGLSVSLQAFGAHGATNHTNTGFDGAASNCGALVCQSDGIGIADDEISFGHGAPGAIERLRITFSEAVTVDSIFFLDLFAAIRGDYAAAEVAYVSANGLDGPWAAWTGTAVDVTGLFEATASNTTAASHSSVLANVTMLDFFTTDFGLFEAPENSDFALAGLQLRRLQVPEPSSWGLFALALGALLVRRRSVTHRT